MRQGDWHVRENGINQHLHNRKLFGYLYYEKFVTTIAEFEMDKRSRKIANPLLIYGYEGPHLFTVIEFHAQIS